MQNFIRQNFFLRTFCDGLKRFIKTLIQFKNIVAENFFHMIKNFFVSNARTNIKSVFRHKKTVRNIFFVVEFIIRKIFFGNIRHGVKQIQSRLNKIKNFFHMNQSFQKKICRRKVTHLQKFKKQELFMPTIFLAKSKNLKIFNSKTGTLFAKLFGKLS